MSQPGPTVELTWQAVVLRPRRGVVISYRLEFGALLLAIALSGAFGLCGAFGLRPEAGGGAQRPRAGRRRSGLVAVLAAGLAGGSLLGGCGGSPPLDPQAAISSAAPGSALAAVAGLEVKGRAPRTGYARTRFGTAWSDVDHNGCDTRDDVLRRDLTAIRIRAGTDGCVVIAGMLADPYTGRSITFAKAAADKVQIDHVIALSDAWQTGAQGWSPDTRLAFANDPLNLLAVDGPANQEKGDSDAASWLPAYKAFRCGYVSRQVAVKVRYRLWVTAAERDAIVRVLKSCPAQMLPG